MTKTTEEIVFKEIEQCGTIKFQTLVRKLPFIDQTDVSSALRQMCIRDVIKRGWGDNRHITYSLNTTPRYETSGGINVVGRLHKKHALLKLLISRSHDQQKDLLIGILKDIGG